MIRLCSIAVAALGLSACATQGDAPLDPRAASGLALAGLLEETARTDPARIAASEPEITALRQALLAAAVEPAPTAEPSAPLELAAAPDLSDARSLMHGVHLASYRRTETAQAGWAQLQVQLPSVAGLEPRLEAVELGERGAFLRLKAGPFDTRAEARAICAEAEAAGLWCQPTHFTGATLSR